MGGRWTTVSDVRPFLPPFPPLSYIFFHLFSQAGQEQLYNNRRFSLSLGFVCTFVVEYFFYERSLSFRRRLAQDTPSREFPGP